MLGIFACKIVSVVVGKYKVWYEIWENLGNFEPQNLICFPNNLFTSVCNSPFPPRI